MGHVHSRGRVVLEAVRGPWGDPAGFSGMAVRPPQDILRGTFASFLLVRFFLRVLLLS